SHFSFNGWLAKRASARPANFQLRETRPMYREKPHKLLQVGVTPTPATSLRSKRSKSEGCRAEAKRRRAILLGDTAALRATARQANSGKRSDCPTVNRVSENKVGSDELERYQHFPPFRIRSSISRAPRCLREG